MNQNNHNCISDNLCSYKCKNHTALQRYLAILSECPVWPRAFSKVPCCQASSLLARFARTLMDLGSGLCNEAYQHTHTTYQRVA